MIFVETTDIESKEFDIAYVKITWQAGRREGDSSVRADCSPALGPIRKLC